MAIITRGYWLYYLLSIIKTISSKQNIKQDNFRCLCLPTSTIWDWLQCYWKSDIFYKFSLNIYLTPSLIMPWGTISIVNFLVRVHHLWSARGNVLSPSDTFIIITLKLPTGAKTFFETMSKHSFQMHQILFQQLSFMAFCILLKREFHT